MFLQMRWPSLFQHPPPTVRYTDAHLLSLLLDWCRRQLRERPKKKKKMEKNFNGQRLVRHDSIPHWRADINVE